MTDDNETQILPVENEGDAPAPPPPPAKGMPCAVKGCIVATIVLLVVGVAGYFGVSYMLVKGMAEGAPEMRKALGEKIDESDLKTDEKESLKASANRVFDKMENEELGLVQMFNLMKSFSEGPLAMLLMFNLFETQHIVNSELSDDEKVAYKRVLQRLLRGHTEKLVPQEELEKLMNSIPKETKNGQETIKAELTEQELRDLFDQIRMAVDNNKVPDEEYIVDIPAEFDRAISEALD